MQKNGPVAREELIRRGVLQRMARVRVYAQQPNGKSKPMVGYLPRRVLEEIRRRLRDAAALSTQGVYAVLEATPTAVSSVRVKKGNRKAESHSGWQVDMRLRIHLRERAKLPVEIEESAGDELGDGLHDTFSGAEAMSFGSQPRRVHVELKALLRQAERVAHQRAAKTGIENVVERV